MPENEDDSILLSCHWSLIRLGDLSRWREMQLVTENRNWAPAIHYYTLAGKLYSASGAPHNQLAMIALQDANHVRAVYHLYRALAAREPHPLARKNLTNEFKKIDQASSKAQQSQVGLEKDVQKPNIVFLGLLMQLHAQFYRGVEHPEHNELENQALSHLVRALNEHTLGSTFRKLILINLAAEHAAKEWAERERYRFFTCLLC